MSWPPSAADSLHVEPPGWYISSPERLTAPDMCPRALPINRLRSLNDGHPKELRGSAATFDTLREPSDTEALPHAGRALSRLPQRSSPSVAFGDLASNLPVCVARFAMSHIYIYLHSRCTTRDTASAADRFEETRQWQISPVFPVRAPICGTGSSWPRAVVSTARSSSARKGSAARPAARARCRRKRCACAARYARSARLTPWPCASRTGSGAD